jgi:hypothetical protein
MVFLRDRYIDPDICEDGETTRRHMLMMDGGRPGYARPSDDQVTTRRHARDAMIEASRDAWKTDARKKRPPDPEPDDPDDPDDPEIEHAWEPEFDARAARKAAYDGYVSRLTDAWKAPARDFAQPDQGTTPAELALLRKRPLPHDDPAGAMRSHLSAGPGPAFAEPDAQKRRDLAWQGYAASLSEAWKHPRGARSSPPTILGAGPAEKVVERGRTDPDAAEGIEGLRERVHGGR